MLPTALLGSLIIFGIVHLTPGGPAAAIAGPDAGPEVIARINQELGLDRPILVQFGSWAWNLAHGDFGRSLINREYVSTLIAQRLPVTATLAMEALFIALVIGVPLGVYAAVRRGSATDTAVKTLSGLTHAFPEFWVGIMAISLFSLQLAWVPATGFVPISAGLKAHLISEPCRHRPLRSDLCPSSFGLPDLQWSKRSAAVMFAPLGAFGLTPMQIYWRFALKNALISDFHDNWNCFRRADRRRRIGRACLRAPGNWRSARRGRAAERFSGCARCDHRRRELSS